MRQIDTGKQQVLSRMRQQNRLERHKQCSESSRQLLSIGVFFIAVVVAILLYAAGLIGWTLIAPVVLLVFGCWMLALAGMQCKQANQVRARSAFGTVALGLCLIAVGGAWFVFAFTGGILYAVVVILIVLAALAIVTALRRK